MAYKVGQLVGALAACAMVLVGCGDADPAAQSESSTESSMSTAPSASVEPESAAPTTKAAPPAAEISPAEESSPAVTDPAEEKSPIPVTTAAEPELIAQAETCDWDNGRLGSSSGPVPPAGPGDTDVASALIGAWQHTHIDSGAGFEALKPTTDIRYVFPTTERLLYCQDVKGATSQAENAADIALVGTDIQLPGGAPGYTIVAWDADTMVWTNNRDGTLYLLQRR